MPEPLKHVYTPELIGQLAAAIKAEYSPFDTAAFEQSIFNADWDQKELKQRMQQIAVSLHKHLPSDYPSAIDILLPVASQFGGREQGGFEFMFFPDFVERYGLNDFDRSIAALEHFTQFSSSEFAVRPFIVEHGDRMMQQMYHWAKSENYHVRRLASEGCRPRLPWAMALTQFKQDPTPILPILEQLKQDDSLYVRRSLANNLNDIAKDNPQIVIELSKKWLGDNAAIDWLVKHGCRTLLKQGNSEVMKLFGFAPPGDIEISQFLLPKQVPMGASFEFSFQLTTTQKSLGKLRLEYAIDFVKARGKRSRKVFKIAEADYPMAHKQVKKVHSLRPISTRTYYPGIHGLALLVNGVELYQQPFELRSN